MRIPEVLRSKRKTTKQPRAVLASKIYRPVILRQILVSMKVASKVKPDFTAINVPYVCPE